MKQLLQILVLSTLLLSCTKDSKKEEVKPLQALISAVDISRYPEIKLTNPTFYNLEGHEDNFLHILKANGVNTIRLRLWVQPQNQHSGFKEVKAFSKTLKDLGFKTWLTLHYSDTWADPGQQKTPEQWKNLPFKTLIDSVYTYTTKVVQEMHPDYIQVGNEINNGLLHPSGRLGDHPDQFKELINTGIKAIRDHSDQTQIIIHYAGFKGSDWFFNQLSASDYDIIGLSYYPWWHGTSLNELAENLNTLSQSFDKKVVIAETSYPFTLKWNDWTNNVVGKEDQLILPDYPASEMGQQVFIKAIKNITLNTDHCLGFCYWGGELIAWKGTEAKDASSWENQALFDFNNKALPALSVFRFK